MIEELKERRGTVADNFHPLVCRDARDLARCVTFLIETKRIADPYMDTANVYEMILCSMRYGNVICYDNEDGVAVGMVSYTVGTMEKEYEDLDTVHVEYCLMEPSLQRTFYFLKCFWFLAHTIANEHPGVKWVTLRAHDEVKHNNRLYSKFAQKTGQVQGRKGLLNVYKTHIEQLLSYLQRFRFLPSSVGREV